MKIELLNKIDETSQLLIQSISVFTDDQFNKIPFEGSWTAAQVTDHISKSLSGVAELLYANTKPTKRQTDEKSEAIKTMFLDFGSKMKSPEFVLPGDYPIEKDKIVTILNITMAKLKTAIESLDLSAISTDFELPGFGEFTRSEWITFAIYHTRRHIVQLNNIYEKLQIPLASARSLEMKPEFIPYLN